jgi:uncharacterized protein (DUF1778 family)
MPTEKPRISITLDPADLAVLDRFAAVSGQPRASFISAMIAAAVPEFERAAHVMELAKEAPDSVLRGVVRSMSTATSEAMGHIAYSVDQSGHAIRKAREKSPAPARRDGRGGEGPRLRGGTTPRTAPKGRKPPSDPRSLTGGSK